MKKILLQTPIEVFSDFKELPDLDWELLQLARAALADSYSPYSNFQVGAALLLANGQMLKGSNQENAAYPLCLCAERVALAAAASQYPRIPVVAIAITAKNPQKKITAPVSPCGACRQVLAETENQHQQSMRVLMQGESGDIYCVKSAKELLPLSFDSSFLGT